MEVVDKIFFLAICGSLGRMENGRIHQEVSELCVCPCVRLSVLLKFVCPQLLGVSSYFRD